MGKFIVHFDDGDERYYLEWSTVVDAPVTIGMTRKAFVKHYRSQYGSEGMLGLPERLARCDETGTSGRLPFTLKSLLSLNRAGKDETELTQEQIVDFYCRRGGQGECPKGKRR